MIRRGPVAILLAGAVGCAPGLRSQSPSGFRVDETTIADVRTAFRDGTLTCRALVSAYLRRIEAYDKRGPALNALVVVSPDALRTADSLDARFRRSGPVGPLHCVPMIVKDN